MNTRRLLDSVFVLVLFFVLPTFAQQATDSLLKTAVMEVYNNPKHSIEIAEKIYKTTNDSKIKIKSLLAMAQADIMLTRYENVIENANEALAIAKETNDFNNQIVINNFLGNHYFRLELKDKAWSSLKIAEDLVAHHPPVDSLIHLKGNVHLLKAYLYVDKLDCDYATVYFDKAIACFEKSPDKEFSKINLGVVYTHKGRCLLDDGKLDEAEKCFRKAVQISEGNNNVGVNIFSRLSLAEVYSKQRQFEKSTQLLLATLQPAQKANQMELIKEIYKQLSDNYLATNDLKKHKHYKDLYDSSVKDFDRSETQSVGKIAHSVTHEVAESDGMHWFFVVCASMVLVIGILFFAVFKLKKKIKKRESESSDAMQ